MQGVIHGACDYLIKPVRLEELRNIWQHVIQWKRKGSSKPKLQRENGSESQEDAYKKRKEMIEVPEFFNVEDVSSLKKPRVNWSVDLHRQFVNAVNQLGINQAVPKKILQVMNVQGLSRENVASHLKKYRLYLKHLCGVMPGPCPVASFQASDDGTPGGTMLLKPGRKALESVRSVKGLNLGAGLGPKSGKSQNVNAGTLESMLQLKTFQQKQAANRAQVFSAIGVSEPPMVVSSPGGGLLRLASLDLGFLSQGQHQKEEGPPFVPQGAVAEDDLATHNISRVVKVEGVKFLPGSAQAESMDLRKRSVRGGPVVNGFSSTRSQEDGLNSNINLTGDMLTHDPDSSSSAPLYGWEGPSHANSCLLAGPSESAMKLRGDTMISHVNRVPNLDCGYGSLFHATPGLEASLSGSRLPSISEHSADDRGQDELQPIQGSVAKEVNSLGEIVQDASIATKLTYARSIGTETSDDNCSFDALLSDLGIVPTVAHEDTMQQSTLELLDVDEYLHLN